MSYRKAELVNRTVASTIYNLVFDVGTTSDYNIHALSTDQPIAWFTIEAKTMEPIRVKMNRLLETHQIQIFFYKRGQMSFNNIQKKELVYEMEDICTEFCIKLQDTADANGVEVSSFRVSPVYGNAAKNIVSGVFLSYTLSMPDDFEYC